jgi:hypothetical protein
MQSLSINSSAFQALPDEIILPIIHHVAEQAMQDAAQSNLELTKEESARAAARALAPLRRVMQKMERCTNDVLNKMPEAAQQFTRESLEVLAEEENLGTFRDVVSNLLLKFQHIEIPFKYLASEQRKIVWAELIQNPATKNIKNLVTPNVPVFH